MKLTQLLKEIKVNKPLTTAFTANYHNKEVKIKLLKKFLEGEYSSYYWTEYPKGYLDLVIYDKNDQDYSVDHDQSIPELLLYDLPQDNNNEDNELKVVEMYKDALETFNLKPKNVMKWLMDDLLEIKVNKPVFQFPVKINNEGIYYDTIEKLKKLGFQWDSKIKLDQYIAFFVRTGSYPFWIDKTSSNTVDSTSISPNSRFYKFKK